MTDKNDSTPRALIPLPDLLPPTGLDSVDGWSFNLHRLKRGHGGPVSDAVYPSWSSGINHGSGHTLPRSGQRGSRAQYSTKPLALHGLRAALVEWTAGRLAAIDAAISAAS